ncbi:MAG: 3-methyladenine DNA glycosylase [Bacteroidetes bacterium GWA2_30_7]|nr:MAG: 3-methyladenine DNA glycosylase [Bacteroidetes bacterium GWA2_30_7]
MRLNKDFFEQDVLKVAPALIGKFIVRKFPDNTISKFLITETEAYRGEEDLACHASKGRTPRTEVMYKSGGYLYIYLIYGMYWMLNIVTEKENNPQAVLIRGIDVANGPGKLSKVLNIDKSFNNHYIPTSDSFWIEDNKTKVKIINSKRIGIDYAGDYWKNMQWRFLLDESPPKSLFLPQSGVLSLPK